MYPDLVSRLRQDIRQLNRDEFYLIRDHSSADGSFLLYHFISLYLRGQEQGLVYVLALNHPSSHYKVVLAKLGVQLQRQIEQQKKCLITDFSYHLSLDEEESKKKSPWFRFGKRENRSRFSDPNSVEAEEAMKLLYLHLKEEIGNLISNSKSISTISTPPLLIVIDCLSVFLDFGIPLKYVIQFLHYLRNFGKQYNASFCFSTKTDREFSPNNCDDKFFSAYDRLASFLESITLDSCLIFDVKPLSSGWSQDVHGEVTIRQTKLYDDETTAKDKIEGEMRLLYKLGDRNVTFMAPGLVPRIGV